MAPTGYLSVSGIESCLQYLATTYPSICQLIMLPNGTHEGRTSRAVKIANGSGDDRHGVLFIGGCHARELINPDMLVSLALKLCQAYTNNTGLTFGGRSYAAGTIQVLVDALDIYIFPLVNPDGRAHVQSPTGYTMWRKNRNPNPGHTCIGVDLNRNFDLLWSSGIGTSTSSCSDIYKGSAPASEPEVNNVLHLLDTYPNIHCMVDVHSYMELILHPWGHDENQTTNPSMNFLNPAYDGLRGTVGDSLYKEYIPSEDLDWFQDTGADIREAIADVRGRTYTVQPGIDLYPTTGTAGDYPYSRHFRDESDGKIYSFTLETGQEFQPPYSEALNVIEEGSAGLIQCCINCLCIVEAAARGTTLAERLDALRDFRSEVLAQSAAGRRYVSMLEKHKAELLRLMATDGELRKQGVELLQQVSDVVLSKRPRKFKPKLVDAVDQLAEQAEKKAGKSLRASIRLVRRELPNFRDNTVQDALQQVEERQKLD